MLLFPARRPGKPRIKARALREPLRRRCFDVVANHLRLLRPQRSTAFTRAARAAGTTALWSNVPDQTSRSGSKGDFELDFLEETARWIPCEALTAVSNKAFHRAAPGGSRDNKAFRNPPRIQRADCRLVHSSETRRVVSGVASTAQISRPPRRIFGDSGDRRPLPGARECPADHDAHDRRSPLDAPSHDRTDGDDDHLRLAVVDHAPLRICRWHEPTAV